MKGYTVKNTCIIDDNSNVYKSQPHNCLRVTAFEIIDPRGDEYYF